MQFQLISYRDSRYLTAEHTCYLIDDNWDDYGFKTLFGLVYFDAKGIRTDVGQVKVMRRGMKSGRVRVKQRFESLDDDFCSLGQGPEYYETLNQIDETDRITILEGLRDVVWYEERFREFQDEEAFSTSLMRSMSLSTIQKFRAIAYQRAQTTPYHFMYKFPQNIDAKMEFNVAPDVKPPTNIHVVIGRNGVGKTRLLYALSKLLRDGADAGQDQPLGELTFLATEGHEEVAVATEGFANLITVAFSAFDDFDPPPAKSGTKSGIAYSYIGLRLRRKEEKAVASKSIDELRGEFVKSTLVCLRSSRKFRWQTAMRTLETDPVFASMQLTNLADLPQSDFEGEASTLFTKASSGHKIVLLTMTRLVELVSERSLVLIDEPEAHLHPPLAASFIRALSELLSQRNGVAILATHSPVMLQEVPQDCVWLLFRSGATVNTERPQVETFAENLGVLTREVFRLEVTNSGYHALIANVIEGASNLEEVIDSFGGHLGAEGRAIARSLWRARRG